MCVLGLRHALTNRANICTDEVPETSGLVVLSVTIFTQHQECEKHDISKHMFRCTRCLLCFIVCVIPLFPHPLSHEAHYYSCKSACPIPCSAHGVVHDSCSVEQVVLSSDTTYPWNHIVRSFVVAGQFRRATHAVVCHVLQCGLDLCWTPPHSNAGQHKVEHENCNPFLHYEFNCCEQ